MHIINEKGRSMIEMLGVLAIIGVLTVGSLSIVGKARQQFTISQIISETSTLIGNARKMVCDYDEGYGTYANMLYRSGAYPDGVTPDLDNDHKAKSFTLYNDAVLELNGNSDGTFSAILSNLPDEACVAVATSDWNTPDLISAAMGSSSGKIIDLDVAASACGGDSAKLTLKFKGCASANLSGD